MAIVRRKARKSKTAPNTEGSTDAIAVFRIQDGIGDHEVILRDRGSLYPIDIRLGEVLLGLLYVRKPRTKPPHWLSYFQGYIEFADLNLYTASTSAVLLCLVDGHTFAVTFGYGRFLIDEQRIERRWGLKVVLNCVAPLQLRSLDHVRLENNTRHTREQLSRAASVRSFGLDVERDILRSLTGRPADPHDGRQLVGSDQLSIIGPPSLLGLSAQLARYERLSRATAYRQHFPWVDNMEHVVDAELKKTLDAHLLTELQTGDLSSVWLTVPTVVDWSTVSGFQYAPGRDEPVFYDVEVQDYFDARRSRHEITLSVLRSDGVYLRNAEADRIDRQWSVYRCLNAELTLPRGTFVLSDGEWYAISSEFASRVNEAISRIPQAQIQLPKYGDKDEAAYNARVAEGSNGYWHCMDGERMAALDETEVEPCDLYSMDRHLVHVKRYAGSKVLSHLFNQGTVSAQLLHGERSCRVQFSELLPAAMKWQAPVMPMNAEQFEVVFVFIDETVRGFQMPFLSKVALRNAQTTLQQLGFRVSTTVVKALMRAPKAK